MNEKTIFSTFIIVIVAGGLTGFTIWSKKHPIPVPIQNPPVTTSTDESKYLVTKEPTMVSVAEDSYLLSITGSYPQFSQADQSFNDMVKATITQLIFQTLSFLRIVNINRDLQQRGMHFRNSLLRVAVIITT
jgi:hypothetical protein